ncbi:MAG: hypothetical protein ACHQO8_12850, partial [Vicinamibacterales bacterium]
IPINAEGAVFVPGAAVAPKDTGSAAKSQPKPAAGAPAPEPIGLHLTIRPGPPEGGGSFATYLLIETNVPVGQFTDAATMRRARWQFNAHSGEPVGIGGAELLAVASTASGPSGLSRARSGASVFAMLPGASAIKGSSYATSVPYYDAQRKTQLLLIVHPRLVQEAAK